MHLSHQAVGADQFQNFGDLLKFLRRRAGLTQLELSIAVGYSESQISRLEKNQRVPDTSTIAARFISALNLQHEPDWAGRLLELAAASQSASEQGALEGATGTPLDNLLADRSTRRFLVGRVEPMRRFVGHLDQLKSGAGNLVLVSGEPGIGKTRMIDEAIAAARARRLQVLIGRCHERDAGIPFLPIADALETYARGCAPATWARLLQVAGADLDLLLSDNVHKYLPRLTAASVAEPGIGARLLARDEIHPERAVCNLLYEMSEIAPTVLVLDDLHWADPRSLELIHHIALHTRTMPVLILGSYREVELERTHPLSHLLVDLNRERLLTRERLRRLTGAETREMLANLLGEPLPHGLTEFIHEETEGNPFFIEELVYGLVEADRIVWNEQTHRYELGRGVTIAGLAGQVPQGIRAAVGARLDRLEAKTQQVLALAAIIGRHFSLDVLNRLAALQGMNEEDVEEALGKAEAARFTTTLDSPAPRRDDIAGFIAGAADVEADYAFDHPLIHHVVYTELDRRRRRRLHAEVGHVLEERYHGNESLYVERIASHYLESDDDAKALHYSVMAGDKMYRAYYDADLALGYYLSALETVVGKEPALRHLGFKSPVPIRRGVLHRFTPGELEVVVAYLGAILQAVGKLPAAKAIALLANRICVMALDTSQVYESSIRLYEQHLLGPDVQKLVVETERGKLVGILEFPGPGGPYPLVMLFHGSPSSKETNVEEAQRYRARGMATLRVDLPRYGETTVPTTLGVADGEILKSMVTAVLAHERVDKEGVGVAGWSTGPRVAVYLCAMDDRVRAMVFISGLYDLGEPPFNTWSPGTYAFLRARWQMGMFPIPTPDGPMPADHSAFALAHRIHCPVLLVYGSMEEEIFVSQNEKLAVLIPHAEKRVWRSGVHVLFNLPEALDDAAEWMKEQLVET